MSQIKVKINGVERQSYIDAFSVRKTEVLSRGADSFTFNIKQYGSKQYLPALSDEIVVEMVGTTTERLFAGYIVDVDQSAEALTKVVKVTCKDYTHTLDKALVSKTYENMTAQAVVQDLISTFGAGFTTTNVGGADVMVKKYCSTMSHYRQHSQSCVIHLVSLTGMLTTTKISTFST